MGFAAPSAGFTAPVPAVTQVILTATITASSAQNTLAAVQTTITPSGGSAYTYAGALTVPTGSGAALDSATTANPSFTPDVVGVYVVTLTATDTVSGASVTKVRTQEVGTTTLSVSIAAISDQSGQTGTISCDSTVSNAIGALTYAWSGEKPDGTAVTFSSSSAADPTITLSDDDVPGNYTVSVTVTDAARRESVSASRSFRVGDVTDSAPRAILVCVEGGVLGWREQQRIGGLWRDLGAHAALTTETDGGVTFAGANLTIPSGLAVSTQPSADPDARYVAISSTSAAFQALWAKGAVWIMTVEETAMETTANARWGVALAFPTGDFDAGAENNIAIRLGHNGAAFSLDRAATNASYTSVATAATVGQRRLAAAVATATSGSHHWPVASDVGSFTPSATAPTRLYVQASAVSSPTAATTLVTAPRVRLAVYPP